MGSRSPHGKGQRLGENGRIIVKYRDTLQSSVQKTAETIDVPFGFGARMGPINHVLDNKGSKSPIRRGNSDGQGHQL